MPVERRGHSGVNIWSVMLGMLWRSKRHENRTGRALDRERAARLYGGTERIASYLTEELVRQGHEVTLFASGDSTTKAEFVACSGRRFGSIPAYRSAALLHDRSIRYGVAPTSSTCCTSTSTIFIFRWFATLGRAP